MHLIILVLAVMLTLRVMANDPLVLGYRKKNQQWAS